MKRTVFVFASLLISTLVCFGQGSVKITPIRELMESPNYDTYYIRASYVAVYDVSKLIFFVEEDEYIIPIQLQKTDLGAEKRFLARNLRSGDDVIVKGRLALTSIDGDSYKGLIDAEILNDEELAEMVDEKQIDYLKEIDVKPSFNGGDANSFSEWVNSRLEYPQKAKKNGIQGCVTLAFTIDTDGRVINVKVLRGVERSLDKEAVRVVSSSPKWSPGIKDGKPVRVTYTFPVIFQLH